MSDAIEKIFCTGIGLAAREELNALRSRIEAFLRDYTAAYEKGNARRFFSYFTDSAKENGKPIQDLKPDYLEIWQSVQRLTYRISVVETEQVLGSGTVCMKGRFNLNWELTSGRTGQSCGEITMDFKQQDKTLLISSLNYRFDD